MALAPWVCELCHTTTDAATLPLGWDLVFQSAVCPACQSRARADGKSIPTLTGGCYAEGRRDPRAKSARQVWKYEITGTGGIDMPSGAEILAVQVQHGAPQLWALVDPDARKVMRRFLVLGTGHSTSESNLKYIATFQIHGGALVFHVFEVLP